MKTNGNITETYLAIARPSFFVSDPIYATELYGQYTNMDDAIHDQKIIGGRIVNVTKSTTWQLVED